MTQRRIANTDIKVIPFGYNTGKKEFKKRIVFTLNKGISLLRALCEACRLLFSGIDLKR